MFSYDELTTNLKKLAKSVYWQTLYSSSKENAVFQLFSNNTNLTSLQIQFLNELGFYSSIYMDIAMNEVSEYVLTDEICEDAYYYYKLMKRKKEGKKKPLQETVLPTHHTKNQEKVVGKSEWVFTKVKG